MYIKYHQINPNIIFAILNVWKYIELASMILSNWRCANKRLINIHLLTFHLHMSNLMYKVIHHYLWQVVLISDCTHSIDLQNVIKLTTSEHTWNDCLVIIFMKIQAIITLLFAMQKNRTLSDYPKQYITFVLFHVKKFKWWEFISLHLELKLVIIHIYSKCW